MSMHNPEMYEKYNAFQKRDSLHSVLKFGGKMNWRKNASIIDLGCGDGLVTTSVLKKHLPLDFKELVGVDISKEMVEYANAKHADDRTRFVRVDIAGDVPEDLVGSFDHAFSSYALQFVPNQEKAFRNIYEVLNEGSTCLLVFLGGSMTFNVYLEIIKQAKWRPWIQGTDTVISRYYWMEDPAKEVNRLMLESGFTNVHVEATKETFEYETYRHLRNMVESANLFHLPPEKLKEFMEDFDRLAPEVKCVENVEGK